MGKAPLQGTQSAPLQSTQSDLAMRKFNEDRDLVADEKTLERIRMPTGTYIKGEELHMSMGHITGENEDRKPKDFKEAISMASIRMIRKKSKPDQDRGSLRTSFLF